MNNRRKLLVVVWAALTMTTAAAAEYPTKPVRIVVGFAPGGPSDVVARMVAGEMWAQLGQPFVVENRPGASGIIAADQVQRSAPDGYTLMMLTTPTLFNYHFLNRTLELPHDFTPVAKFYNVAIVVVVNPAVAGFAAVTNVAQLVAVARARPNGIDYTSTGTGSIGHLSMEVIRSGARVPMTHIAYKGAALAMTDTIAGQVPVMLADAFTALAQVKAGKVRAIGVGSGTRVPDLADVPTLNEQGFAGLDKSSWSGMVAPSGIPADILQRLMDSLKVALAKPEVHAKLRASGLEPAFAPSADYGALVNRDFQFWGKVIRENGIKAD